MESTEIENRQASKTTQKMSFDNCSPVVSPLKLAEGPASEICNYGGEISAISNSTVSFDAVDNSSDPTSLFGSIAYGNHGRSSSPKTSQQSSLDYFQVVSPQLKVQERGSGLGGKGGSGFAEKGDG